jgi:hypothetical protein
MIKILALSDYRKINSKSARLVYICLWAWGYMDFKKACLELGRRPYFKNLEKQKSKSLKQKDIDTSPLSLLLNLGPPSEPFIEKKFLKIFPIGRTTFINALGLLEEDEYLIYESSIAPKKKTIDKKMSERLDKLKNEIKKVVKKPDLLSSSRILQRLSIQWRLASLKDPEKDFDDFFIDWLYRYLSPNIWKIEAEGIKKKRLYIYVTERKARLLKLSFSYDQLNRKSIIQIPLNILTRKDLTIAERLIGIELHRMKKEEGFNIRKKGNKSFFYIKNKRIKLEDLAEKIEFSKPVICGALRKL